MPEIKLESLLGIYVVTPLLVLLMAPLFWRFLRHKERVSWRTISLALIRLIVVSLLSLVLSNPYLEHKNSMLRANVLVDISDSFDPIVAQKLLNITKKFSENGMDLAYYPFATQSGNNAYSAKDLPDYLTLKNNWAKLDFGQTNIEQGLQTALNDPLVSTTILVTDGYETKGAVRSLERRLAGSTNRIFPLALLQETNEQGRFKISQLRLPLMAKANSSVEVRVTIENNSAKPERGQLEIVHGEKKLLRNQIELQAGEVKVVTVLSDQSAEGINEIVASLKPNNTSQLPSSETAYLSGEKRERVLLISKQDLDSRFLKEVLLQQAYQLDAIVADAKSPVRLPDLTNHSVVILNNIPLVNLHPSTTKLLDDFVAQGGGLIMIGGGSSFGLGGYHGTTIAKILPVEPLPPQTEQRRLNTAVALLLDKSTSMQDDSRIEFTREAAKEVVRNLKNDDYISIVGFATAPFMVLRLTKVAEARNVAISRIDRIVAVGNTNLLPALDEARRALERAPAARKHMIILTDGKLPGDGGYFVEMIKQLRLLGVSTSTVLVGAEVDDGLLKAMAEYGGGAFYHTLDPRSLPQIFLRDVKVATGEMTIQEKATYQVRAGGGTLRSTSLQDFPALQGYVKTKIKAGANLELIVQGATKSEPLLASWQYGKGRSIAFTSDVSGRWSSAWVGWSKFHQFWTELISSLRPRGDSKGGDINFDLRTFWEHGAIVLDLALFSETDIDTLKAKIVGPDQRAGEVVFEEVSRGRFKANWPTTLPGKYEVQPFLGDSGLTPVAFHLSGDHFGEIKGKGFNLPMLNWLAQISGGKINPGVAELKRELLPEVQKKYISNWLMLAALSLFLLEIICRRSLSFMAT